ncbi:MAG: hypothetical protein IJX80_08505 [Clostridia bacterium]|nr:hypothetical protein [Clostridia bacterium]
MIGEDSQFNVPLYAYSGYTKFTALQIVSYDATKRTVTLSDKSSYAVSGTPDGTGYYGTFTYGGTQWMLTTGEYAASTKFGDGVNLDRPMNLRLPEISYVTDQTVYMEASYYIALGSKGDFESQITAYTTDGVAKNYLGLYVINMATGAISARVTTTGSNAVIGNLAIGQWNTVGMLLDLVTGKTVFFLNGLPIQIETAVAATNLVFSSWSVAKVMKAEIGTYGGSFCVDNVSVYGKSITDYLYSFKSYSNDFETYTQGDTLTLNSGFFANIPSGDIVGMSGGNRFWLVDATVINQQNRINNLAIDAETIPSIIYEAKYYIPASAKLQMQSQLYNMKGTAGGTEVSKNFNDLYILYADGNGITEIRRESDAAGEGYTLPTDEFFTVSVALNLTDATFNVYVNNKPALENQQIPYQKVGTTTVCFDSITEIPAGSVLLGKINSAASAWASGYAYIDDIKVYAGTDKNVDGSIPATATFQTSMQAFLYLESEVKMGVGYKIEGMESISPADLTDRFGLLIWNADEAPTDAEAIYSNCDYIVAGAAYNATEGRFETTARGIAAKNLGDRLTFRAYYRNDDGSYSYSRLISGYSPKTYCYNQIKNNPTDTELVDLMASILNYGAAAQTLFDYKTDDLMNADLTDAQKVMTWDGSLVRSDYSVPDGKDSAFVRDSAMVTSRGGYLNLEGAIDYNFYAKVNFTPASAKIYYWTENDVAALDALTLSNASSSEAMVWSEDYSRWEGKYEGQPAKEMFNTVYACMVFEDAAGNTSCSGVIGYSPERYAYINQNKGDNNAELAKRLVVYGDAARAYFD